MFWGNCTCKLCTCKAVVHKCSVFVGACSGGTVVVYTHLVNGHALKVV